jgi:hypothetical protein
MVDEDVVQRHPVPAEAGFEFSRRTDGRHLAQVHDRHATAQAIGFFHQVCR